MDRANKTCIFLRCFQVEMVETSFLLHQARKQFVELHENIYILQSENTCSMKFFVRRFALPFLPLFFDPLQKNVAISFKNPREQSKNPLSLTKQYPKLSVSKNQKNKK